MESDCDVVAVIEGAARTGMAGCWTAVEALTEAFWGPVGPSHKIADAELGRVERALGSPLPAALRDGYRQFGRLPLLSTQDRLIKPQQFTLGASGELVFRVEKSGVRLVVVLGDR